MYKCILCVLFILPLCINKIVVLLEKAVSKLLYSTKQMFRKVAPLVMHCVQVLLTYKCSSTVHTRTFVFNKAKRENRMFSLEVTLFIISNISCQFQKLTAPICVRDGNITIETTLPLQMFTHNRSSRQYISNPTYLL